MLLLPFITCKTRMGFWI